jgi:hypothetical protein
MRKNYSQLTRNIQASLNPESLILEKAYQDELGSISYSDVLVFIRSAMKGVEPEYTRRSKEAGEKVKDHLKTVLTNVVYKYQGSVMTDTHIKGYSDIDLLTITNKFYSWDSSRVKQILENHEQKQRYREASIRKLEYENSVSSYSGNSLDDLREIRTKSEQKMKEVYIDCDINKPKSIKITNRNLKRDVDIVTANWYDDVTSIINDKDDYRGIQVYNKIEHKKGPADFPFLSIARINDRSSATMGRLKKMIRFLKHCKAGSVYQIELSSFDINAICYDIDPNKYNGLPFYDLVPVLYRQLKLICEDDTYADNIVSVDGREYIFRYNSSKKANLKQLLAEVEGVYLDLVESKLLTS